MPYIDPRTVVSPRNLIRAVHVLHDSGPEPNSWSVALLNYLDGNQGVGFRWNGDEDSPIGNPQSHGKPTWSILPEKLAEAVLETVEQLNNGGLLDGYRAMAADPEREAEAQEWCEGLIHDAAHQER
ncbi:MAG: hypothetical protein A3J28_06845 [Acidobacteria bacterium RIFCSPLOWO2_12_FULL_60_22]|nr:MAG: hypothetical protein A3J28_06845 [Acidobacteria bacterium RIFCSPLOWO2_12_FULL_60_22]